MRRLFLAVRAFFRVLFNAAAADQVRRALEAPRAAEPEAFPAPAPAAVKKEPPAPTRPLRNDAVTLLAALQREARFVDFVQESLETAADAEIGAVAREVHRGCREVLARLFALRPVVDAEEGSAIDVPRGFDAGRYRLTGNVTGEPPFHGTLAHHGWEATTCQLPEWTGSAEAARIIAPAEVELK
ncbi:MAG TPA: DUF2760 domain-containing protein [Planctomycetaceae bacterium]|nr:DUF2760 domain-containing protein [Planctomycetaceae bacterium]